MTAYISRLLSGQSPAAGIRPRPRSRYELEPDTHLGGEPTITDLHDDEHHVWAQQPRAGDAAPPDPGSAPTGFGLPKPPPPPSFDHLIDRHARQSRPAAHTTTRAESAPSEPARDHHRHTDIEIDTDQPHSPAPPPHTAAPGHDQTSRPLPTPQHVTAQPHTPTPNTESTPAAPPAPPAGPAATAVATSASQPAHTTGAPVAAPPAPPAGQAATAVAASASQPAHTPPKPAQSTESRSLPTDPVRPTRPATTRTAVLDADVRQTIVNAITEPARAEPTQITVRIDRIDVHAPSPTPAAAPEPRRPRAAPTSLQSYLRSRSTRAAR